MSQGEHPLNPPKSGDEPRRIKRFYKEASVGEVAEGGYAVLLDGRSVKTPRRATLILPTRALAEAVAEEWRRQGDEIRPETMGLMALAATALDRIAAERPGVVAALAKYAETDLLCYREDRRRKLAARQAAIWQPLLDWAALTFDARLNVVSGIMPVAQPAQAVAALRRQVESYDDMRLAALSSATQAAGSLLVALALIEARIDADEAFEAAELEATFQIEEWGEDYEAMQRREVLKADLTDCERFIKLLQG